MVWHVYNTKQILLLIFYVIIVKGGSLNWNEKCDHIRAMSHMVPSPKSLEINMCNLSRLEHGSCNLPLHMGPMSQVPNMTWMHTWQHFWRRGLGLVLRVGSSKKLDPSLHTSPTICFFHKLIKIRLQWQSGRIWMISWDSEWFGFHVGTP